jgi:tetratricopeptide (TPR) repeat protein
MRAVPWVIFAIALSVRLLHVWLMRDTPYLSVLTGDSRAYDEWATRIAGGDWIGGEVFYQAPLYPYFLAVIYASAGRDLLMVRVVQAVLGACATALLADAGARAFSRRTGTIAGVLMAFYAPAIFLGALIQKSVLDVFLVCLIIWVIARAGEHDHARREWLVLGIALGLLCLTRENALLLVPVPLLFVRRSSAALIVAGVALVLLPVALRNQSVGGGFYLTTAQFGPNLYIGNHPGADGTYQALREGRGDPAFERLDATELAEAARGRRLTPAEVSAYWRDEALRYVREHPVDWLRLMGRKALLLVSATELPDTEAQESHADESLVLAVLQPVSHFGIVMPLALLGIVVTWRTGPYTRMYVALAAVYAASVLAFFVFARYRYPLVPFLLLFAAAGIAGVQTFVRTASARQQVVVGTAMAAVLALALRPVLASDAMRAISATNVGVALQAQGRDDEAAEQYRRAISARPDYAPAYNNLGVVLRNRGRIDEAIAAYRQSLAYHPDDAGTRLNLGEALLYQGRGQEAIDEYRRRVELAPRDPAYRYDLGNVLLETGHIEAAEHEFRALVALAPDAAQAHNRLGVALAAQERFDEAMAAFERALQLQPDFAEARGFLERARNAKRAQQQDRQE